MTENARYTVVAIPSDLRSKLRGMEVRQTAPSVIAKVQVDELDIRKAGNTGFRPLAGYIFGRNAKNEGRETGDVMVGSAKIAMTTPVTMQPAQAQSNEKIAMTTPVTFEGSTGGAGGHIISFTMPSQYRSVEQLPIPLDSRVTLKEQPARYELVSTRRGQWPDQQETEKWYAEVVAVARAAGLTPVPSAGSSAGHGDKGEQGASSSDALVGWQGFRVRQYAYDPPFIPSFLKVTEVAVEIESPVPAYSR